MRQVHYKTPEESFAARTERRGECLIWTGRKDSKGYGGISVNRKMVPAHRYAWERVHGPIPDGVHIDHKDHCDHACVEVSHLRESTPAQNIANRSGPTRGNKSTGVRNVYPHRGKYRVQLRTGGKAHLFGSFDTIEEAAKVAVAARAELFGEFAGKP